MRLEHTKYSARYIRHGDIFILHYIRIFFIHFVLTCSHLSRENIKFNNKFIFIRKHNWFFKRLIFIIKIIKLIIYKTNYIFMYVAGKCAIWRHLRSANYTFRYYIYIYIWMMARVSSFSIKIKIETIIIITIIIIL